MQQLKQSHMRLSRDIMSATSYIGLEVAFDKWVLYWCVYLFMKSKDGICVCFTHTCVCMSVSVWILLNWMKLATLSLVNFVNDYLSQICR
jgi:hypothetical protein